MYKKILVGIDDSKHAEKTLKEARSLQKKLGCELVVFHSTEHKMLPESIAMPGIPFSSPYRIPVDDYKQLAHAYLTKGEEILKKAKQLIGEDDPKVEFRLVSEIKPEDYAISSCIDEKIDLILMGSKGDHNIFEKIIGSVSEKVLNEAKCDVLLVK